MVGLEYIPLFWNIFQILGTDGGVSIYTLNQFFVSPGLTDDLRVATVPR
jgi:hypothetical protein